MLLSCWRTRWVRFPRAALQYFTLVLSWLYPANLCIMRTHAWEKVRLAATRHEVVALELSSGECGAAIQPGTAWSPPRWTDRQMEGMPTFFSHAKTDSDTRCHVGSSLTQRACDGVGPTPDKAQQAQDAPAAPATSLNRESRVPYTQLYMGRDLDWISSLAWSDSERMRVRLHRLTGSPLTRGHAPLRCLSRAGKRRRPALGPCACTQLPAPTTRMQHSTLARRLDGLEITTPHPGDDQLSYPFRPLAATTAAPREGRRAAHHLGPSVEGRTRVLSPPGTFTEVTPGDRRIMVQAQSSPERARMPISRKPAHLVPPSDGTRHRVTGAAMRQILCPHSIRSAARAGPIQIRLNSESISRAGSCRYSGQSGC